jgi:hypothetical protein
MQQNPTRGKKITPNCTQQEWEKSRQAKKSTHNCTQQGLKLKTNGLGLLETTAEEMIRSVINPPDTLFNKVKHEKLARNE